MSDREQQLQQQARASGTLLERLRQSRTRIAKMCAERRGPRMTIPVEANDDDFFICLALEDAIKALTVAQPSAERYQWLRSQHWNDSAVAVVTDPKTNVRLGVYCPSEKQLDDFIDAAMAVTAKCNEARLGRIEQLMAADPDPATADGQELLRLVEEQGKAEAHLMRPTQEPTAGPLKLDTDRQVFFYEQDHYYLSNFSAFELRWHNVAFPTSEHAYHWEKFTRTAPHVADLVRFSASAHEALKLAELHKDARRHDWDEHKVEVMRRILLAKTQQHEYIRRKLLETGDRELIENSWRDDFWGWGPNRDGQNMLGKLWMEIRAELRAAK